jgi:hypothetical protein
MVCLAAQYFPTPYHKLNIFEREVYRRILGPVYDNEKENWTKRYTKKYMVR